MQLRHIISPEHIHTCADGFRCADISLGRVLWTRGIVSLPGEREELAVERYYDDWYPFTLPGGTWGLVKMREQEHDGFDGDDPGVTVSFLALGAAILQTCLSCPTEENRASLRRELHRVTARKGLAHSPEMKAYFADPRSPGAYLVARLYVRKLASKARDAFVPLPHNCRMLLAHPSGKRLRRFLTGCPCFTGEGVKLADPACPTWQEQLALLATHTANTSWESFAAEVCFHAAFLLGPRWTPFYASALRADMAVGKREWGFLCPYYREKSIWMRQQRKHHPADNAHKARL